MVALRAESNWHAVAFTDNMKALSFVPFCTTDRDDIFAILMLVDEQDLKNLVLFGDR